MGGGWGSGFCFLHRGPCQFPGRGGAGGAATATATTTISKGATSASATSFGGTGGSGGSGVPYGGGAHGGTGGDVTTAATASTGSGPASATATSTGGTGGAGGRDVFGGALTGMQGFGGHASASASAISASSGPVQATASAYGGVVGAGKPTGASGWAYSSASAQNQNGDVQTTGTAPNSGSASALTEATILVPTASGSVSASIVAGRVVSFAIRAPIGPDFGIGAMAAAYGGRGEPTPLVDYTATALFDFTPSNAGVLDLNLISDTAV